jgi:hypothetical protein
MPSDDSPTNGGVTRSGLPASEAGAKSATLLPPTVHVVLHDNYGGQGVDFHGAFSSRVAAEKYVVEKESDEHERQYWEIEECQAQG